MTDVKLFRNWCRWLRRNAPVPCQVRVYLRSPSTTENGLASWKYDKNDLPMDATIEIVPTLNLDHTAEILIHEWAHIMRAFVQIGDPASEDHIQAAIEREISNKWDKMRLNSKSADASGT